MITETLLNSLKSLFSSLGAKTSDNNYAVGLFDKTNGEPKGMMGMSDLASVLGVPTKVNFKRYEFIAGTYSYNLASSGILMVTDGTVSWFGYYYYNNLLQAASNVGSDMQVSVSGTRVTVTSSRAGNLFLIFC